MRRFALILGLALSLAGCVPTATAPVVAPKLTPQQAAMNFRDVIARVEPVAEQLCQERTPDQPCDFAIYVDGAPQKGVNAFHTIDEAGRPAIIFTLGLITMAENADELAFVMSHEAGHHIGRHLPQVRARADLGAEVFAQIARAGGASDRAVGEVAQIGAAVVARQFSRQAELDADAIGTIIALRAGYDPLRGAAFFARIPDPARNFMATHPPNAERMETVRRTVAETRRPLL